MLRGAMPRLSAAAVLLLTACATPGPKEALEPIEAELDAWAAIAGDRADAPVTSNWLADLNDPGVETIVSAALTANFDLRATGERVIAARNQARVVRSGLFPTIGASLNANRSGGPRVFGGIDFGDQFQTTYSTGFNLNWEADVWGRLTDATRAAYLDASARAFDFAAARLSLAGNAATAHYDLTAARLQRQLAERDVETGKANLRIIERRYERGISTSLDLRLARSSLASSEAALQSRIQQELEAARRLEVVLGRYPSGQLQPATSLPTLPRLAAGGSAPLGSPEELLSRRPDLLAAERRLEAAGLRVSEARKAFLPRLSLSASATQNAIGPNTTNSVANFGDLWDFDTLAKNLAGNLTQPLFQGGQLIANEQQRRAEARAALYDYATTALNAWREVEDAIAAERFLAEREAALRVAAAEAKAAEELTERRYLAGTTNIFDLINAQQRRIAADGQLIDGQRARLSNRIDLYLALGAPYLLPGSDDLADAGAAAAGKRQGGVL